MNTHKEILSPIKKLLLSTPQESDCKSAAYDNCAQKCALASFTFFVFGAPKGQPRPRAFARKMGEKYVARVYDDGTAEGWKSLIAASARNTGIVGAMLEGPVKLRAHFIFGRPKSHFRSGRNQSLLKDGAPRYWHTAKPDGDNLIKAVKDCLKQLGAYRDDSQVCDEQPSKTWALNGEPSGAYIHVQQIEDRPE